MDESELEPLLALDGADFEMVPGVIVEFYGPAEPGATPERPTASATPWSCGPRLESAVAAL